MRNSQDLDWSTIETVLLDMDGTLLDLNFDNWFWQTLVPQRYAEAAGLSATDARRLLNARFASVYGTLKWYCIDHWSRELELDIGALKRTALSRIVFLPGAQGFLERLKARGKRVALVTNAHPRTFAIKNETVLLSGYFDAVYSTHDFDAPKEDARFWPRLRLREEFTAQHTLFVDDSLAVLDAARRYGIGHLRMVRRPDSGLPPQDTADYVAVDAVADLL